MFVFYDYIQVYIAWAPRMFNFWMGVTIAYRSSSLIRALAEPSRDACRGWLTYSSPTGDERLVANRQVQRTNHAVYAGVVFHPEAIHPAAVAAAAAAAGAGRRAVDDRRLLVGHGRRRLAPVSADSQ